MALQKQNIPVSLSEGLNTKVDEKLVQAGQALTLENAEFDKIGAIVKPPGLTTYSTDVDDGNSLSDKSKLNLLNHNDELLTLPKPGLSDYLSWTEYQNKWVTKEGNPMPAPYDQISVTKSTGLSNNYAMDVSTTLGVEVFVHGENGSFLTIRDIATGNKKQIEMTEPTPNVASMDVRILDTGDVATSKIFVIFGSLNDSEVQIFDMEGDLDTTILTSTSAPQGVALRPYDGNMLCLFVANGANCNLYEIDSTGSTVNSLTSFTMTVNSSQRFDCFVDGDLLYIASCDSEDLYTQDIDLTSFTVNTSQASRFSKTATANTLRHCTICDFDATNAVVVLGWNNGPDTTEDYFLITMTINKSTHTAGTDYDTGLDMYPTTRCEAITVDGNTLVLMQAVIYQGVANNREFLVSIDFTQDHQSKIIASLNQNQANINDNPFPKPIVNNDVFYTLSNPFVIISETGSLNTSTASVLMQKFYFDDTIPVSVSKLGSLTTISGGYLLTYDGQDFLENNFFDMPAITDLTDDGTGSEPAAGTYSYIAIYEYIDSEGNISRSVTSDPKTISGTSGGRIVVSLKPLRHGRKSEGEKTQIKIYRTTNGGSVYYFVDELDNGRTLSLRTYNDTSTDASIEDNQILYTNGGVLDNDPAQALKYVDSINNRVFGVSSLDPNVLYYSKKYTFGEDINFSDLFSIRIDSEGQGSEDGIVGIAGLDGKIVCFKENRIFIFSGDGPNELGQQDTFTVPQELNVDTGCNEPRSIVNTPIGIMFKSNRGIYVLDRSLQVSYIGAPVEGFNSSTITSANLLEDRNQVRFSLSSGQCLVFDYLVQRWSVFTEFGHDDAVVNRGRYTILDVDDNDVRYQDVGIYTNDGVNYSMKIETPWFKVSGIQDFARIYRALLLGKYKSGHDLVVQVYYDYDDTLVDTYTIAKDGTETIYQTDIHLAKQKCQSIKFIIYDNNWSGSGESMELTNLTLRVGLKGTAYKGDKSERA